MESKEVFTDCTLCYHSCGTKVTVEDGKAVKIQGLKSHPLNKGRLCPKGAAALEHIYSPNRLKHPMKRVNGSFTAISWDQALDEIAEKLSKLKQEFGPQTLGVFSGSIGVENLEMAGLVQRFRAAFGSPNFFSVESVCYRMRIRARQLTFGRYPVEERDSNLYILWGHNPDESDLPLSFALNENLRKGAKLVVIDPKRIPLADKADMYLKIRPGTDGALALAVMQVIITENRYDREFIDRYTIGFQKLASYIADYTPEWAETVTWVPANQIRTLARLFASTKGASIFQGTCTQDQTANGTQNSRAFSVLQTITGNINVPGGWVITPPPRFGAMHFPPRTDRDPLGAEHYTLFSQMWGRKSPYGVIAMVPENIPGELKAFVVVGGNPLISMPDSSIFSGAFQKLDLLVVHDLFMTDTCKAARYVLPACSHLEKWGIAYTYNVCHGIPYLMLRKKCIDPLHESWSEWKFLTELAARMGFSEYFPWPSEEDFVSAELEPSGLSFAYLLNEKPEGDFYRQKEYYTTENQFKTPSRKIEIYSEAMEQAGFNPLPSYQEPEKSPLSGDSVFNKRYPLILSTGNRSRYYTHSQHRSVPSLRRKKPDPFLEIGPKTAEQCHIKDGDTAIVETHRGRVKMKAHVSERVAEGVVLVPHGWGSEANANLLTDVSCTEPVMGYPQMKSLLCSVRPARHQDTKAPRR